MKHLKSYQIFNEGFKDTMGNEYSVKKINGFYRIYVITPKMRQNNEEATDCEKVFGKGLYWVNYENEGTAIDKINTLTKLDIEPDMDSDDDTDTKSNHES